MTRHLFRSISTLLAVGSISIGLSAAATPRRAAAPKAPRVQVVEMTTWVAPRGTVRATLSLTGVPRGAHLQPVLYDQVSTRSAFALTLNGRGMPGEGELLAAQPLDAGATSATVQFAVDDGTQPQPTEIGGNAPVTLHRPGVYPLVFQIDDGSGTVTSVVSYVVRLAAAPAPGQTDLQRPLRVASVVTVQPGSNRRRSASNVPDESERRMVTAFITGLSDLAGDSSGVANSFDVAISPELVEAFATSPDAQDRLEADRLRRLLADRSLLPLPYTTVALSSWLATPALQDRLAEIVARGDETTRRLLHPASEGLLDATAWSGATGAPVTGTDLRWLVAHGASHLLLRADQLTDVDEQAFPRTIAQPFEIAVPGGSTVPAFQIDDALSAHFNEPDPVLGVNHLMADLAVLGLDLPALDRGVVVSPPAGWTPSAVFLADYVAELSRSAPSGASPLVVPTATRALFTDVPAARAAGDQSTEGPVLVRTLRAADTRSRADTALGRDVASTAALVKALGGMEPGGHARAASFVERLNRQLDVAAGATTSATDRTAQLESIRQQATAAAASVTVPTSQMITLTSHTADIPFTIRRRADGPRIVHLSLSSSERITFEGGSERTVHLTGSVTQVRLRVHLDSPGDTVVEAQLTSPDGTIPVAESRLLIRSTAVSGMGLVITFGSLAFLLLWWARDVVRVRRRRRAARIRPADLIDID